MNASAVVALVVFVALVALAAAMGSRFRPGEWYERLNKPSWRPPNWLFAPVWSALYLMIAIAGWLVWQVAASRSRGPAGVVARAARSQRRLVAGVLRPPPARSRAGRHHRSVARDRRHRGRVRGISAVAAWLLVPYFLWVSFATALNVAIWRLNRPMASRRPTLA